MLATKIEVVGGVGNNHVNEPRSLTTQVVMPRRVEIEESIDALIEAQVVETIRNDEVSESKTLSFESTTTISSGSEDETQEDLLIQATPSRSREFFLSSAITDFLFSILRFKNHEANNDTTETGEVVVETTNSRNDQEVPEAKLSFRSTASSTSSDEDETQEDFPTKAFFTWKGSFYSSIVNLLSTF